MSPTQDLSVPTASNRGTTSRSTSASGIQQISKGVDKLQELALQSRPKAALRAESESQAFGDGHDTKAAEERPMKINIPAMKATREADLRSGLASPMMPVGAVQTLIASIHADDPDAKTPSAEELSCTIFFAGPSRKPFEAHNHLLSKKVPYFRKVLSSKVQPTKDQLTFETIDEFAAAIFIRWLYGGELHGPGDFHSMHHYLALYVLGFEWDVEDLCNEVMDLVRAYYRHQSMTAPAFRLEYIYTMTTLPNYMRNFLTQTAAYRVLCEAPPAPGVYVSESIKGVVRKLPDLAVDFAEALAKLSGSDTIDPRKGKNCNWHEHSDGKRCKPSLSEPYE